MKGSPRTDSQMLRQKGLRTDGQIQIDRFSFSPHILMFSADKPAERSNYKQRIDTARSIYVVAQSIAFHRQMEGLKNGKTDRHSQIDLVGALGVL